MGRCPICRTLRKAERTSGSELDFDSSRRLLRGSSLN